MGNSKIKLFLDFDETIARSNETFIKLANSKFGTNKNKDSIKSWNFKDLYPQLTDNDKDDIFCGKEFFEHVKPFDNIVDIINKFKDDIEFHIATIGLEKNLINKKNWLTKYFKDIDFHFHGIAYPTHESKSSKACVDMHGSIFIDDRVDNLMSSNAKYKILFRDYNNYEWQYVEPNSDIYIVDSWEEIHDFLQFIIKNYNY